MIDKDKAIYDAGDRLTRSLKALSQIKGWLEKPMRVPDADKHLHYSAMAIEFLETILREADAVVDVEITRLENDAWEREMQTNAVRDAA